jgi:hypothetical protein
MDHPSVPNIGRRDILRVLALGTVAATGSACTQLAGAGDEPEAAKDKPRYRVTDNVKAFYRVNRY